MRQLTKLLKNLLILLTIIFILDRGIGSIIEYFFLAEKQGDTSVATHAITKAKENMIIFGSSRAAHHYVSSLIETETKSTCYNVGRDGMGMTYYNVLFNAILESHTPDVVILDLNFNDFSESKNEALYPSLLPYIGKNKTISTYVKEEDPLEFWKAKVSKLYQFNSLPASILQHYLGIGQTNIKGYEGLKGSKLQSFPKTQTNNPNYKEDPFLVNEFESFIQLAVSKKIKLYVVISPASKKKKYTCKATANKILNKYGMQLLDYSELIQEDRKDLYYDATHLNNTGATYFTEVLLKETIKNTDGLNLMSQLY